MQDEGKYKDCENLMKTALERIDLSYLDVGSHDEVLHSILKTLDFLGFFTKDAVENKSSYLNALSCAMQKHLNLND